MRELFRDLRFRKALSYAINREGITNSIFPGPLIAPYEGSLVDSSVYYDPDAIVFYAYDLEKSKGLFAELGFKDIDGDGIMEWSTGTPLAGQDLTLVIHIIEDETAAVNLGEALVPYLREAGIKAVLKVIKTTTFDALSDSGELEIPIRRDNNLCLTPLTRLTDLGPVTEINPWWHQAGPGGKRDLFPFEARLRDLINSLKTERSGSKVRETFSEIQHLWTENVYTIGLYKMQVGNAIAKRLRNVPPGTPPYMYEWFDVAQCAWQLWVPKEEQKPEILPGVIPTYEEK
ncbi:Periplasmic alpha-galactoside-binding protein [subsurface metagenome]